MYGKTHDEAIRTIIDAFTATRNTAQKHGLLFPGNLEFLVKHVIDRYSERWRHFHDIRHIADGAEKILGLWPTLSDQASVMTAWLFHDVVFTPGANGQNEECSAQYLEGLYEHIDTRVIRRAAPIIRATTTHLLPEEYCGDMQDLATVLDIDLSGLANRRDHFIADGENIRNEPGISNEDWVVGRAKFAEMLLAREKIFHTKHFAHCEEPARENLEWAIAERNRVAA